MARKPPAKADEGHPSWWPSNPSEKVKTDEVTVKANATKPPPRYSEATLLSAMEGAGKMVDDEELKAAMAGRGLGTPATRAQIIENLIGEQYMHREGRELIPTAKAFSLMTLLQRPRHQRTDPAGADRRLGVEARPHRERRIHARRVHA